MCYEWQANECFSAGLRIFRAPCRVYCTGPDDTSQIAFVANHFILVNCKQVQVKFNYPREFWDIGEVDFYFSNQREDLIETTILLLGCLVHVKFL